MNDTYLVNSTNPVTHSLPSAFRSERRMLARRHAASQHTNDFAAAKDGLDGIRSMFYSSSGRMPNTRSDATRRQRSLLGGSGDRHLTQLDLWAEREISRHLRDHSSIFTGIIETWAAEVIQCGFRLKPATGDDDLNLLLQQLLFGWDGDGGWCNSCDARGMLHFWDLLTLAEETELTDGDHGFFLNPNGNGGRGTIAIIEGDRILTPHGLKLTKGYQIANGIVFDSSGRAIACFVANDTPMFSVCDVKQGRFFNLFDEANPALGGMLMSVEPKRYTASRRQPWLSTAVRAHDEIDDVFVAVRIHLRNIACRATYTTIKDWDAYKEFLELVEPGRQIAPEPEPGLEHSPNPGDHFFLNPGEENGIVESSAPGENFDPFMKLQLNSLGLPLGMCMEEALRLFQKSFSSSRMAVDGTRRRYERRQRRIKRRKVRPLLSFAIARHQALGVLPDDPRCEHILCGFPGWPYMEPLKDAQASAVLVNNRLRSRRTCATEIGDDYDQEIPLIQQEAELFPESTAAGDTTINLTEPSDSGGGE